MYRQRWGVEVYFHSLKQTLERTRLLSTSASYARVELDWQVMGLWMMGLMCVDQIVQSGDIGRLWSVAACRRVIRLVMQHTTRCCKQGWLAAKLGKAVQDAYQRQSGKAARNWPHKKTCKPAGAPQTRTATEAEVELAQRLKSKKAAA